MAPSSFARTTPKVSLRFTLDTVCQAVGACRMLAEAVAAERLGVADGHRDAQEGVAAQLAILEAFLKQAGRVLAGEADARSIWMPTSAAPALRLDGHDLVLRAWEPRQAFEESKTSAPPTGIRAKTRKRR